MTTKKLAAMVIIATIASSAGGVLRAETISFTCGNMEFQLNTNESTISNRFLSNEPVQWSYDGEWLRWIIAENQDTFGVNVQNGYFISGGQADDVGCRMLTPSALATLPISEGAALRRIFVSLEPDTRKAIQAELSNLGLYASTLDGLWGRGTERAVLQYYALRRNTDFSGLDISSETGAQEVVLSILGEINEGDECDGCDIAENSNIATPPSQPAADFAQRGFLSASCISILQNMDEVLEIENAAGRREAWEELGVNQYWIDSEYDSYGSLLSREITPEVAVEICEKIDAVESRFIGFERSATNGSTSIRHVTYETNEVERERLSIEWALLRGRVGGTVYNRNAWRATLPDLSSLPSRAVSFILVETQSFGRSSVNCFANYFVFHETHPMVPFTRQRDFLPVVDDKVWLDVSIVFGQPFISFWSRIDDSNAAYFLVTDPSYVYNDDGSRKIFWGIAPTATNAIAIDYWGPLRGALSENFSAFEDAVNFEGAVEAFQRVGEDLGFASYTVSEAPAREQSDIVNHPSCQAALEDAREQYSREIVMFRN